MDSWPVTEPVVIPALKLIIAPAPIVSFAEAQAHLRLQDSTEQTAVTAYVAAATAHLDAKYGILSNVALGVQTWELYLDAFPCGPIKIPLSPLIDVVSIIYYDADGVQQQLSADAYLVDDKSDDGWIVPVSSWPATLASINVVTVQFRVGRENIPAPIKAAVLLLTGHLYEHREAVSATGLAEVPIAVDRLVAPYRRIYV